MKKIFKSILYILGISVVITSCDFDTMNYQDIPTEDAYENLQDIQNGMHGAYYALGHEEFYGKNVIAIGDMAADISLGDFGSGHYADFSRYAIADDTPELSQTWEYGYKVIDRSVRTIQGGNKVMTDSLRLHLTEDEKMQIKLYQSQCYALKALSHFALANIFALPYKAENLEKDGIVLVKDRPIEAFEQVSRSNIEDTYALILKDIKSAKDLMEEVMDYGLRAPLAFYMNEAAINALEARVNLFMGNYEVAKTSAERAIELKGTGDKPSNDTYLTMWSSLAISEEDIFTISKTENDNLSANSLNALYGSYYGYIQSNVTAQFDSLDIRLGLISGTHPMKFDGIPTSEDVSNIPVFRKSEMYLIIGEAEAHAGNITPAQDALFHVAKRNLDITDATQLPATPEALLTFISKEYIREFFQEGLRFYNVRRTGEIITVGGTMPNFDASKFVFPIPADEINAHFGVTQNEGWFNYLPTEPEEDEQSGE